MADNITIKDGGSADKTMAADEVAGVLYQVVKMAVGGDGLANFLTGGAGAADAGTLRAILASDDRMTAIADAGGITVTTGMTRPANTTTYAPGDAWANATSGASVYSIANASRGAGRSGLITDIFMSSPRMASPALNGELWIFDSMPATPLQDNAAWALTNADLLKVVDVVTFDIQATGSSVSNGYCRLPNLNIGFTTAADANLYVIPKITSAYAPASAEVLTMRTKIARLN